MNTVKPLRILDQCPQAEAILDEVSSGLHLRPKRLPSKFFYDAAGSALFEQICAQPEYYLTRAELEIMRMHAADMAACLGPEVALVEYGSGSGLKTRLLLRELADPIVYVPMDISSAALAASGAALAHDFPALQVLPLCADFTTGVTLPTSRQPARRRVIYFPGSTLGNFEAHDAARLLRQMRVQIGRDGAALIGIDLKKDRNLLEAAYNDAAGVTAMFTLNMLARFNRELGADFDLAQFRHRARYNDLAGRIETHIVSRADQEVRIGGERFHFATDEMMLVEYSCKYTAEEFARLAAAAGLRVERHWSDVGQRFSVQYLVPEGI